MMTYSSAVNFLESLSNLSRGEHAGDYMLQNKKNNPQIYLKRLDYFLNLLGNPHQPQGNYQPKYIHITGTSGKGTTCALMQTILAVANYKVGAYFSPHQTESYERIRIMTANIKTLKHKNIKTLKHKNIKTNISQPPDISRYYISKADFARLAEKIKPSLNICATSSPFGLPSYFEIFLCVAFLYFKEQNCDYIVLEVGCGGRYDATNIITNSELAIITNIGDDHRQIIGPKLTNIAYEKAGIIKKGGKVLVGPEIKGQILQTIKKESEKQKAELITMDKKKIVSLFHCFIANKIVEKNNNETIKQWSNEIIATGAAEILKIPTEIIQKALMIFRPLPCRFEIRQIKTLSGLKTIILDGAHNPDKIKWLYNQIVNWLNQNDKCQIANIKYLNCIANLKINRDNRSDKGKNKRKIWLIFGVSENKNWTKMLKTIMPISDKILLTRHLVALRKCVEPKKMFDYIKKHQPPASPQIFLDPTDALRLALDESGRDDLIVITGSLFLAGYLRKILDKKYCST